MPFGVSIYRTGCPNFIAFVLKIGLEYVKASFNNKYDKHSVLKLRTNLPVLVQVDSPGISLDLQGYKSEKKWPLKLLCLPLPPKADVMFGICELGEVVLGQYPHACVQQRERKRESGIELNLLCIEHNCSNVLKWVEQLYIGLHTFYLSFKWYWAKKCNATLSNPRIFSTKHRMHQQNTQSCDTAEQQLLAVFFQQRWEHGPSEMQWMLAAGCCSTSEGDGVSDAGVLLSLSCWPVKTCWDLNFCDTVRN